MILPGVKHLAHSGRWLRSRFIRGGLILAYHRISAVDWDPFSLSVSPEHFAEHLAVLRSHASPLRLADLVQSLDTGRIPYAATALTFDDGYVDNLSVAKPLLVQHSVAATVFVATGHRGSEFWWDTLARLLAPGQELPATVRIAVGERIHTWKSPPAGDVNGRRRLLFSIHSLMQPLSPPLIQPILHSLSAALSPMSTPAPFSRALTTDEVTELARGDLVDIGAHGDTHSLLAQLPVASQQSDIRQSKTVLESLLGRPILGFAYPYGSVSPATLNIVRGSGFAFACSSHTDVTSAGSNRFLLPRFWIPNWDGRRFLGWLMRWLKK
jgi:peptidoglycan/xylan/chitin deacetylase (PgdA/CDA1 family)